jgi:succinate-acetate transporter protein
MSTRYTTPDRGGTEDDAARTEVRAALSAGRPTPLGLVAFGIPAFALGTVLAGWWTAPAVQAAALVPILIAFGGIVQFIVAMWAYRTGETLAATFFGAFGGLFATLGLYVLVTGSALRTGIPAWALVSAMGPAAVIAACFCFVALFIGAGAMLSNPGVGVTSLVLGASLFFASWALFAQGDALLVAIAGWIGLISGGVGLLSAAGMALGSGIHRFRLFGPLGSLLPARGARRHHPSAV